MYVSNPPPPGADVTPCMQSLVAVQRALEEEKEEKGKEREDSPDWSSFSSADSESAEKFVVRAYLSDKAGSASGMSKRAAKDVQEVEVAPPLKKACTAPAKWVAKKALANEVLPLGSL